MSESTTQIIHTEFESAIAGLVEYYAEETPEIAASEFSMADDTIAAIVGFGDAQFRGSAVVVASESVAQTLSGSAPINTADWIGELCNQLVGRLKNKLASYGVLPQLGSPVTICGRHMSFYAVGGESATWLVRWSGGRFLAMLLLHLDDELELTDSRSDATVEEGSVSLF
jgi:hypothetical protein